MNGESSWFLKTLRLTGLRGTGVVLGLLLLYAVTLTKLPAPAIILGPHYIPLQELVVTSPSIHPTYSYSAQMANNISLYGLQITVDNLYIIPNACSLVLTVHMSKHPSAQQQGVFNQWFGKHPMHLSIEDQTGDIAPAWVAETIHSSTEGHQQDIVMTYLMGRVNQYTTQISLHFQQANSDVTFTMPITLMPISDFELPRILKR